MQFAQTGDTHSHLVARLQIFWWREANSNPNRSACGDDVARKQGGGCA